MAIGVGVFSWLLFALFQARGIYAGDSGDLVTAAATFGVPHPPGYPLYTALAFLLSRLPVFTVAWRVALLSSLPSAAVAGLLFWLVRRLTGSARFGIFAAALLVGNYLFFLYSVTTEVFALLNLFIVLLFVLLYQWSRSGKRRFLSAFFFVFGLSVSHHHLIVFLLPAFAYWVWAKRHLLPKPEFRTLCFWGMLFLTGLLPYGYIVLASRGSSAVNWDRAVDAIGFFRLLARADYGTFQSSGVYGVFPIQRLIALKAYGQFLLLDVGVLGFALALCGFFWLYRRDRILWAVVTIALISVGPVFFAYASFPLANPFTLGTYERFLLPSYVFLALLAGLGASALSSLWRARVRRFPGLLRHSLTAVFILLLAMYPAGTVASSLPKFKGMATDRTAERLGEDILATLPAKAILFLSRDTSLFTTQYVRYVRQVRPDTVVLHYALLGSGFYPKVIAGIFPQLVIPEDRGATFPREFVKANRLEHEIYATASFSVDEGWYWVPEGLLFHLVAKDNLPDVSALLLKNQALWQRYQDPASGLLHRYPHLMLADTPEVYAQARLALGSTLIKAGRYGEAIREVEFALRWSRDLTVRSDGLIEKGTAEMRLGQCDEALDSFQDAAAADLTPGVKVLAYRSLVYRDCFKDPEKADDLLRQYNEAKKREETPLETL